MLAVSGKLNLKAGGPSVMVPVDQDLVDLLYKPSQWAVTQRPDEHDRRSIYLIAKRNLRLPFMEVFDQPMLQTSCAAPRVEHACAAGAGTAQRQDWPTSWPQRSPSGCNAKPAPTQRNRSSVPYRSGDWPARRQKRRTQTRARVFCKSSR